MKVLEIGKPVRGSTTGRPIMVVLDLLGRRGALRVLWELGGEPLTFRALQAACASNPGLLNTRLAELRGAGIIAHAHGGYRLTRRGRSLRLALDPLLTWAKRWAAEGSAPRVAAAASMHRRASSRKRG
jgi:DNA-binding HxlR family transcriptional regulator